MAAGFKTAGAAMKGILKKEDICEEEGVNFSVSLKEKILLI